MKDLFFEFGCLFFEYLNYYLFLIEDIKNISKQNLYNKVNDNFEVNLIPKKEILVDRLLRYGENIEKKKERIKFENENNFKIMSHPQISDVARSINRDPNKFVERLFYDKYTCDK